MSTINIILLSIFSVLYVVSCLFIYFGTREDESYVVNDHPMVEKVVRWFFIFLPINILLLLYIIFMATTEDVREKLTSSFRKKRELKRKLKEREKKLKLGIIRVSEIDPYGEEDWEI